MKAMVRRKVERLPHMGLRIQVGGRGPGRRRRLDQGEIDAARIDHGKVEQAARGQGLEMGEARGRVRVGARDGGIGRIDQNAIHLRPYAFDDARIDLPIESLRAAIVVGMRVHNGSAGTRTGDALLNDRFDGIGNARLQPAAPGAVQRHFDPDFPHRDTPRCRTLSKGHGTVRPGRLLQSRLGWGGKGLMVLTPTVEKSTLGLHSIQQYEPLIGRAAVARILDKAERLGPAHLVHISSTFYGGGVTEILTPLTLMMNAMGIATSWHLIQGTPAFFHCTKKLHNTLQGETIEVSEADKAIYEQVVFENATRLHIEDCDAVIVHDPQPLPLIEHFKERDAPWIWQCHVDLSSPNPAVWNYLRGLVEQYDSAVFSLPDYAQQL